MSNKLEEKYTFLETSKTVSKTDGLTYKNRIVNAIDENGLTDFDNMLSVVSKNFWMKKDGVSLTTVNINFQQLDNAYLLPNNKGLRFIQ